MGALSLRGFALAHLGRHVLTHTHAHTESALSHVGPIDLSGQSLLRVIMQFNSGGKSISLLLGLANTEKGNLGRDASCSKRVLRSEISASVLL